MKKLFHALCYAIFWIWNISFLSLVYLWILPLIGVLLIVAIFAGEIENEFLFPLMGLIAGPLGCTLIGAKYFNQQPLNLLGLFYGVEAPLFLLCILRMFLLRELSPGGILVLSTFVACIAAYCFELLCGYAENRRPLAWLQMATHSLMLLVGLYVGELLLFYAIPAAAVLLYQFFSFGWVAAVWTMLTNDPVVFLFSLIGWLLFFVFFFGFTATLFVGMPTTLATLYVQSGLRIFRRFASQYGQTRALQVMLAAVSAWVILFVSFQQQPQVQAFQLLDKPVQTDSQRQKLLAKSDVIREGLLNAYLSSYRYVSPVEESNNIQAMYRDVFGCPERVCQAIQDLYNQLMSPFLYNGSRSDSDKAEKLYAQFFDAPIQKAERKAVQRALQSTAILDEAKAGVLNINQKKVWLREQNLSLTPHGDWADVELHEVYENQTDDVEEILYYFSLPESAAITGIWLGDSDNLNQRFPFTVSPRGAAQKVYNSQVRSRERPVDPALLEQVGPRLYRLRAFPVPPKVSPWERRNIPQRPTQMHLWLTYKVMRQQEGWALPRLGEKRNIFWSQKTKRIQNGQVVAGSEKDWLPAFLPATGQQQPSVHQLSLPNGYRITAKPLIEQDYVLPQGKRFAVILDSSRSMGAHVKELTETLSWLKKHGFADNTFVNNDADLYITASAGAQPRRLDDIREFNPAKKTFYGTLQLKEMLKQFAQLRGDTAYDGILLVTDEGSYELSDNRKDVPKMPAPLWMVHLGAFPPAYDDATLKAIQNSGGGISTELPEVLRRLATKAVLGPTVVSVVDGYAWSMEAEQTPTESAVAIQNADVTQNAESGFAPLAARQIVTGLSQKGEGQLSQLDAIHAVAKSYKIVTPYSSMIVLVNDAQREALKKAEAAADRFDRKVENGKEQLNKPSNPLSVSVPEPGTVVGLVILSLFLIVSRHTKLGQVLKQR